MPIGNRSRMMPSEMITFLSHKRIWKCFESLPSFTEILHGELNLGS